MKVIIPMAGMGKRFIAAGYQTPKPLIEVNGMPVAEHVIRNFSAADDFVFGINQEHSSGTEIRGLLKRLAPVSRTVVMPYQTGGPVATVRHMFSEIQDDEPVIVNYCDFSWVWDYEDFKRRVLENGCDGAVVCYRGFHPHLRGPNRYATLDADGLWMKEIREKHSWHDDKKKDWSSSGTYYFKKGSYIKKYFTEVEKRREWLIGGEHYVSHIFQLMKEDGLRIFIYEIPFMLQWGTPEDLEEYLYWSAFFRAKKEMAPQEKKSDMAVLVLMAGAGKRFADEGYGPPKPYIHVDGGPMALRSTQCLPRGSRYFFVTREELRHDEGAALLKDAFTPSQLMTIEKLTEGQASTALLAKKYLNPDEPVLIGACDHALLFDPARFAQMTGEGFPADALIFTFRRNPTVRRNPKAYGWVETDETRAVRVSVKVPLPGDPMLHHAIIGSFWFRKALYFTQAAEDMIAADDRVNGEFYIDQCMNWLIKKGLRIHVFEVDYYASWGTPDDLKTYEYWQRFFHRATI